MTDQSRDQFVDYRLNSIDRSLNEIKASLNSTGNEYRAEIKEVNQNINGLRAEVADLKTKVAENEAEQKPWSFLFKKLLGWIIAAGLAAMLAVKGFGDGKG